MMNKAVRDLALLYLLGLAGVWWLLWQWGGAWWPATVITFAPRWAFALPMAVLVPFTLLVRPVWLPAYLLHAAILLGPVMDYRLPPPSDRGDPAGPRLKLITCNVGGGTLDVAAFTALVREHRCDLVLVQECPSHVAVPLFESLGWGYRSAGHLATASRFELGPVEILARHDADRYLTVAATACSLDWPVGGEGTPPLQIVNVHLPTLRPGLEQLLDVAWEAGPAVRAATGYHRRLSQTVREALSLRSKPLVVAGDFNMPRHGRAFREHWGSLQNAFTQRGRGFGYTKYTRWHGIRIDHVLSNRDWHTIGAQVGPEVGGDHRPVIVELQLVARESSR